ncbi:MAG: microcystin degradation protein MlrC-like protein, partial [Rhizobacter sp.]|nr:microcystin degradation protein MlrC-like protein [Rhizobacter sp.]
MRLFAASLATETNTFSPLLTSLDDYKRDVFLRPGEHPEEHPLFCTAPLWVARRRAKAEGYTLVEGSCFAASPAGTTNRRAYEAMRDEILDQVRAALPLDGVVLGLHGAMVADGYDDVEGDVVARVRMLVGTRCVIGVELDPHCHVTRERVKQADITILYKEFPHTDVVERAEEILTLVLRTIRGEVEPVSSIYDCQQLGSYRTTLPLMRALVDDITAMEGKNGVLSISIGHSFPYGDVPEIGVRVLVIADRDKAVADRVATEIGQRLVGMRGKTMPEYFEVEAGLAQALAATAWPVVIADPADNAGGGAGSDNTTILRALIAHDVQGAAIGPLWDPIAVRMCFAAEVGGRFQLRLGGKASAASGVPVDAWVEVVGLARDCHQTFGPTQTGLGDCAAVRIGGVEVVLTTARTQALGLELFTNLGIDPARRKVVVVKSNNHFVAAYGPVAARIMFIDADGPMVSDFTKIPYRKVNRPLWPLDEET